MNIGDRFGQLVVKEFSHSAKGNGKYWLCVCDCGREKVVRGFYLKTGHTKSCGCRRAASMAKTMREYHLSHGQSNTSFYDRWAHMLQRCYNPRNLRFKHYGGRGIEVCLQWHKFENFRDDMFASYLKHVEENNGDTTIERCNNDGNYTPGNCKWATLAEQNRNRRYKVG